MVAKRPLVPHPDNPLWMLVPLGGKAGGFAVVDVCDAEEVGRFNWCAVLDGRVTYARAYSPQSGTSLQLHRLIGQLAGFGAAEQVDHRNHDGLDCRRSNLRPATAAANQHNTRRHLKNTSGYKGVTWVADHGKWKAAIRANGRNHFLGYFDDAADAAHAYDVAAREHFNAFASVNFPAVANA